jgi:hypothetical protein
MIMAIEREVVSAFSPAYSFPTIGTAQERTPDKKFRYTFSNRHSAPLWTITTETKRYIISKPIKVLIYPEDNLFFAENETLVVIGTGDSATEAINDFCRHVIHFYHYYKRLPLDKATGDAIRLKKLYETLFTEAEINSANR